jgi:hypothetical protein
LVTAAPFQTAFFNGVRAIGPVKDADAVRAALRLIFRRKISP